MYLIKMSWLSLLNLQFFHMTKHVSWMPMNYGLELMFDVKYWLRGKIVPRKGQHGKMFSLLRRNSLLLFLRTKTFHKGVVMSGQGS